MKTYQDLNLHVVNPIHAHYWETYSMKTKITNANQGTISPDMSKMWKFENISFVVSNSLCHPLQRSIALIEKVASNQGSK